MGRKDRYLAGLDVGTSKIAAIVAEAMDDGELEIIGIGIADSKGIKRGVVVNLEAAVESIKKAIEEAELMGGVEVDSVHLAVSGPHIKGFNSRGVIAVAGKNREITRDDVRRAIDAAKGRRAAQRARDSPRPAAGLRRRRAGRHRRARRHDRRAARSERPHRHGSASSTQNIVACVNRAGMDVIDMVIEQLAAAEAVLTDDEKDLGVALVDIGGGTTDLAIFERGSLWHTAVIPVGGDHFTNDIAVGLRTPIPDAEKIKRKCGCALSAHGATRRRPSKWRAWAAGGRGSWPGGSCRRFCSHAPRKSSTWCGTRFAAPATKNR